MSSEPESMAGEQAIQEIKEKTENRPTRRGHQPTQADSTIRFSKNYHSRDKLSILSNTMDRAHRIGESNPIIGSVERRSRDVGYLQSATTSIQSVEKLGFTAAKRTGSVNQNFEFVTLHNVNDFRLGIV